MIWRFIWASAFSSPVGCGDRRSLARAEQVFRAISDSPDAGRFVIVDEHRGGDMHRVHQTKTFSHTASLNQFLNFRCDIDEPAAIRHFEPKMFRERFQ